MNVDYAESKEIFFSLREREQEETGEAVAWGYKAQVAECLRSFCSQRKQELCCLYAWPGSGRQGGSLKQGEKNLMSKRSKAHIPKVNSARW